MINIQSNGSKWAGQAPDSIEKLLEVLAEYTLDPSFENYGNFITPDPVAWDTLKPLYPAGTVSFFGNFRGISHVFNIDTDEPKIIDALTRAIRANQATADYQARKAAMQGELDATAKELELRKQQRERTRRAQQVAA